MGPWLKKSHQTGMKLVTLGLQGKWFIHYTLAAPVDNVFWYYRYSITGNVEITSVKFGAISKLEPDTSIGSHTGR